MNDIDSPISPRNIVFVDRTPHSGAWNMAVDEAMLEAAADEGRCSLRLYRWSEPTVSLGYFQKLDPQAISPELAGLPVVRRLSGGGAILHHHELTYSLALPRGHSQIQVPSELYGSVHAKIRLVLAEMGIMVEPRGASDASGDESFLCFQRGDSNDLVVAGHKVVGSAQRRRRGAVLQHGSLLLERSPHAPEMPGLCDLGFDISTAEKLATGLAESLSEMLGAEKKNRDSLSDSIIELARELEQGRYQKGDWKSPG